MIRYKTVVVYLSVAILALVTVLPLQGFALSRPSLLRKTKPITSMGYGIARYAKQGIVVIKPKSRNQMFIRSGSTSSGIYHQHPGALAVINGAYFGRFGSETFYPAGVRTTGEKALDPSLCQDINLCSVYHMDTLGIGLFPMEGWFTGAYRSSGPILVQQGIINPSILRNRSHWQRKTYRTVMIPQGPYFIVTTTGYSLPEMAEFIIKNFGKVDAINLDGGSSTSLYSRNVKFNSRARLPEFIVLQ
ncbi:MAG: phosphodiester glycosidase family protein [Candidatus Absconditabacterales bacterium]